MIQQDEKKNLPCIYLFEWTVDFVMFLGTFKGHGLSQLFPLEGRVTVNHYKVYSNFSMMKGFYPEGCGPLQDDPVPTDRVWGLSEWFNEIILDLPSIVSPYNIHQWSLITFIHSFSCDLYLPVLRVDAASGFSQQCKQGRPAVRCFVFHHQCTQLGERVANCVPGGGGTKPCM